MRTRLSLRGRLFVALFLTAAVPSALLLLGSSLLLREIVVGTGSAGPWGEVAASGGTLMDALSALGDEVPDEVRAAAAQHQEQLSESVRLSRLYAFLGERVLGRLPWVAGGLFLLAAGLSLWSAKQVSRALSRPVREIVQWTEKMGRGEALPPPDLTREGREIREFRALRGALRHMEGALRQGRARELAEARNRSWSEMARRIAHDLKNPLAPMRMAAQTVLRSSDSNAVQAGEVLLDEIARLDELSRSFAQFGRPPEGPPSAVDMRELVNELSRRVDPGKTLLELDLPPDPPLFVHGHPVALERVLRNLIVNALDAGAEREGEGTPVQIVLRTLGDGIEVRILDHGPGLPPGDEARIWEPDFTTKRRGTGLGLPLVQQVVEAHGGHVEARTRPEGGAEFRLVLPAIPHPETSG